MADETLYRDRAQFLKVFDSAFKAAGIQLKAPAKKAVVAALSERDPSAEICRNRKDEPEPDPELRDTEIVPLPEGIPLPLPLGYEIPLNRHFYVYQPPRRTLRYQIK